MIGGLTGAFVVIVAGIVAAHGVEGLFLCTLMAGIMLGVTGMGSAVRFIPRPVVVGLRHRGSDRKHPDSRLFRSSARDRPR